MDTFFQQPAQLNRQYDKSDINNAANNDGIICVVCQDRLVNKVAQISCTIESDGLYRYSLGVYNLDNGSDIKIVRNDAFNGTKYDTLIDGTEPLWPLRYIRITITPQTPGTYCNVSLSSTWLPLPLPFDSLSRV